MKRLLLFLLITSVFLTACTLEQKTETKTSTKIDTHDYAFLGNPEATVTIVEYSDYECRFCKQFTLETLPKIKELYIDTGKVNFVFKDFPLGVHPGARAAAVASNCAGEQGKYFAYHDLLFETDETFTEELYNSFAEELELDIEAFNTCRDDPKQLERVMKNYEEGKKLGVKGTPTFFIDGVKITGAQPLGVFQDLIEMKINNAEVGLKAASSDPVCKTNEDCPEAQSFGPYCSANDPNEFCTTSVRHTCSFGGMTGSTCVAIVEEDCTPCEEGFTCVEGACEEK